MKLYLSSTKLGSQKTSGITVAVYGLGKMGLPLAAVFANAGFHVIGVDVNEDIVRKINAGINPVVGEAGLDVLLKKVVKGKKLSATTDLVEASQNSDIKIILVPTYLDDNNKPDMTIVKAVSEKIAKGIQKGDIVISECTLPPGTSTELIGKTIESISGLKLNKDFGVAHCPERTSSGTAIADIQGRLNPKIVGGSDKKTTEIVTWIYKKINKNAVIPVKNTAVAEMVKVSEGIYRDVNIALANNVYMMCRELGIDAKEVIEAANTDAVCHFLTPGPGVGGHCIPVYPYFILNKIKNNRQLLELSRKVNDDMSHHVIELAEAALRTKRKRLKTSHVLVLGLAYRGGVKETRKSPGLKIAKELQGHAKNVYMYDPLFSPDEVEKYGLEHKENFRSIDCVIIATNHQKFKNHDWKQIARQMRTRTLVDTVHIVDHDTLIALDFAVKRIGYAD